MLLLSRTCEAIDLYLIAVVCVVIGQKLANQFSCIQLREALAFLFVLKGGFLGCRGVSWTAVKLVLKRLDGQGMIVSAPGLQGLVRCCAPQCN